MNKLTILLLLLVLSVSCGKYEEGPGLSLRTKQNRLKGEWKLNNLYISNGIVPSHPESYSIITFKIVDNKNNAENVKTVIDETYDKPTESFSKRNGKWSFIEGKASLELNYYDSTGTFLKDLEIWKIVRLTNKELILEKDGGTSNKIRQEWVKIK